MQNYKSAHLEVLTILILWYPHVYISILFIQHYDNMRPVNQVSVSH